MRKIIFTALVAVCAALPTRGIATDLSDIQLQTVTVSAEVDPALVEQIIRYVQVNYGLDYVCLCDQYNDGTMTIDKVAEGYLVTVDDGGGLAILIDDDIL